MKEVAAKRATVEGLMVTTVLLGVTVGPAACSVTETDKPSARFPLASVALTVTNASFPAITCVGIISSRVAAPKSEKV